MAESPFSRREGTGVRTHNAIYRREILLEGDDEKR